MTQPIDQWYYAKGNQQQGPVSKDDLQQLVTQGMVTSGDLVWAEGMAQWEPAGTVFAGAVAPAGVYGGIAGGGDGGNLGMIGYYNPMLTGGMPYAGFWWRFLAALLDGALVNVVSVLMVFGIGLVGATLLGMSEFAATLIGQLLAYVVAWLYEALMTSSRYCGTLGKMAVGLKVVRPDGQPIGFGRATGRHFAKYLSAIILMVGYIMAAFTEKKQGLHDIICDTIVIRKP